jgi:hypothetical protein
MAVGGGISKTVKHGYMSYRCVLLILFFFAHGQPAYRHARHDVRFHVRPKKMSTPAVQGIESAHRQQGNALVCGRKIFFDPLS